MKKSCSSCGTLMKDEKCQKCMSKAKRFSYKKQKELEKGAVDGLRSRMSAEQGVAASAEGKVPNVKQDHITGAKTTSPAPKATASVAAAPKSPAPSSPAPKSATAPMKPAGNYGKVTVKAPQAKMSYGKVVVKSMTPGQSYKDLQKAEQELTAQTEKVDSLAEAAKVALTKIKPVIE